MSEDEDEFAYVTINSMPFEDYPYEVRDALKDNDLETIKAIAKREQEGEKPKKKLRRSFPEVKVKSNIDEEEFQAKREKRIKAMKAQMEKNK